MQFLRKTFIPMVCALFLLFMAGCVIEARPVRPVEAVVVEPGYYYDEPYIDVYGVYHPRAYYYYHERHWEPRVFVPYGYAPRPRFRR